MQDQPVYYVTHDPSTYARPRRSGGKALIQLAVVGGMGYVIFRLVQENERLQKQAAENAVNNWNKTYNTTN